MAPCPKCIVRFENALPRPTNALSRTGTILLKLSGFVTVVSIRGGKFTNIRIKRRQLCLDAVYIIFLRIVDEDGVVRHSTELRDKKHQLKVSNDRALAVEGDGDTWRFDIVLTKNLMPDVDGRMAQPGANIHDAQRELQKKDPSLRLTRIYASRVSNVTVPKAQSGQNFIGDIGSGRYIFSARLLRGGADVLVKIFECERSHRLHAQKRQDRH
ncbi:hypothetical protein MVEG_03738 [Podila verticillata NRRL 6337]|nr:hypothetical protein MVEG_03738 [Podila verticillata NRRL 6337]